MVNGSSAVFMLNAWKQLSMTFNLATEILQIYSFVFQRWVNESCYMPWGWVNYDIILNFVWTNPWNPFTVLSILQSVHSNSSSSHSAGAELGLM